MYRIAVQIPNTGYVQKIRKFPPGVREKELRIFSPKLPRAPGVSSEVLPALGMGVLEGNMKGFAAMAIVGTLALTVLGATAFAADKDDYKGTSYEDRNGVRWYPNRGYDRGMKDGSKSGHQDAEKGFRYRADQHGQFRSGTDGWNGRGKKDEYVEAYRAGYTKGYKQAFNETMHSLGYRQVR